MHSVFPSEKEQKARRVGFQAMCPSVIRLQLIRPSRAMGYNYKNMRIVGQKHVDGKIVNLQNAEVTKMLDTKNEMK